MAAFGSTPSTSPSSKAAELSSAKLVITYPESQNQDTLRRWSIQASLAIVNLGLADLIAPDAATPPTLVEWCAAMGYDPRGVDPGRDAAFDTEMIAISDRRAILFNTLATWPGVIQTDRIAEYLEDITYLAARNGPHLYGLLTRNLGANNPRRQRQVDRLISTIIARSNNRVAGSILDADVSSEQLRRMLESSLRAWRMSYNHREQGDEYIDTMLRLLHMHEPIVVRIELKMNSLLAAHTYPPPREFIDTTVADLDDVLRSEVNFMPELLGSSIDATVAAFGANRDTRRPPDRRPPRGAPPDRKPPRRGAPPLPRRGDATPRVRPSVVCRFCNSRACGNTIAGLIISCYCHGKGPAKEGATEMQIRLAKAIRAYAKKHGLVDTKSVDIKLILDFAKATLASIEFSDDDASDGPDDDADASGDDDPDAAALDAIVGQLYHVGADGDDDCDDLFDDEGQLFGSLHTIFANSAAAGPLGSLAAGPLGTLVDHVDDRSAPPTESDRSLQPRRSSRRSAGPAPADACAALTAVGGPSAPPRLRSPLDALSMPSADLAIASENALFTRPRLRASPMPPPTVSSSHPPRYPLSTAHTTHSAATRGATLPPAPNRHTSAPLIRPCCDGACRAETLAACDALVSAANTRHFRTCLPIEPTSPSLAVAEPPPIDAAVEANARAFCAVLERVLPLATDAQLSALNAFDTSFGFFPDGRVELRVMLTQPALEATASMFRTIYGDTSLAAKWRAAARIGIFHIADACARLKLDAFHVLVLSLPESTPKGDGSSSLAAPSAASLGFAPAPSYSAASLGFASAPSATLTQPLASPSAPAAAAATPLAAPARSASAPSVAPGPEPSFALLPDATEMAEPEPRSQVTAGAELGRVAVDGAEFQPVYPSSRGAYSAPNHHAGEPAARSAPTLQSIAARSGLHTGAIDAESHALEHADEPADGAPQLEPNDPALLSIAAPQHSALHLLNLQINLAPPVQPLAAESHDGGATQINHLPLAINLAPPAQPLAATAESYDGGAAPLATLPAAAESHDGGAAPSAAHIDGGGEHNALLAVNGLAPNASTSSAAQPVAAHAVSPIAQHHEMSLAAHADLDDTLAYMGSPQYATPQRSEHAACMNAQLNSSAAARNERAINRSALKDFQPGGDGFLAARASFVSHFLGQSSMRMVEHSSRVDTANSLEEQRELSVLLNQTPGPVSLLVGPLQSMGLTSVTRVRMALNDPAVFRAAVCECDAIQYMPDAVVNAAIGSLRVAVNSLYVDNGSSTVSPLSDARETYEPFDDQGHVLSMPLTRVECEHLHRRLRALCCTTLAIARLRLGVRCSLAAEQRRLAASHLIRRACQRFIVVKLAARLARHFVLARKHLNAARASERRLTALGYHVPELAVPPLRCMPKPPVTLFSSVGHLLDLAAPIDLGSRRTSWPISNLPLNDDKTTYVALVEYANRRSALRALSPSATDDTSDDSPPPPARSPFSYGPGTYSFSHEALDAAAETDRATAEAAMQHAANAAASHADALAHAQLTAARSELEQAACDSFARARAHIEDQAAREAQEQASLDAVNAHAMQALADAAEDARRQRQTEHDRHLAQQAAAAEAAGDARRQRHFDFARERAEAIALNRAEAAAAAAAAQLAANDHAALSAAQADEDARAAARRAQHDIDDHAAAVAQQAADDLAVALAAQADEDAREATRRSQQDIDDHAAAVAQQAADDLAAADAAAAARQVILRSQQTTNAAAEHTAAEESEIASITAAASRNSPANGLSSRATTPHSPAAAASSNSRQGGSTPSNHIRPPSRSSSQPSPKNQKHIKFVPMGVLHYKFSVSIRKPRLVHPSMDEKLTAHGIHVAWCVNNCVTYIRAIAGAESSAGLRLQRNDKRFKVGLALYVVDGNEVNGPDHAVALLRAEHENNTMTIVTGSVLLTNTQPILPPSARGSPKARA